MLFQCAKRPYPPCRAPCQTQTWWVIAISYIPPLIYMLRSAWLHMQPQDMFYAPPPSSPLDPLGVPPMTITLSFYGQTRSLFFLLANRPRAWYFQAAQVKDFGHGDDLDSPQVKKIRFVWFDMIRYDSSVVIGWDSIPLEKIKLYWIQNKIVSNPRKKNECEQKKLIVWFNFTPFDTICGFNEGETRIYNDYKLKQMFVFNWYHFISFTWFLAGHQSL
jgi:hypothetical protein